MFKHALPSPTLAETALSQAPAAPSIKGTMAGLTALAIAASVILATTLPVSADRKGQVCAALISASHVAPCGAEQVGLPN